MPSRNASGNEDSSASGNPSASRPANVKATFIAFAGGPSRHGTAVSTNGSIRVISARALGTSTIRRNRYAAAGIV